MTALAINQSQNRLLGELICALPQYDGLQMIDVLKKDLAGIKKCKRVNDAQDKVDNSPILSAGVILIRCHS